MTGKKNFSKRCGVAAMAMMVALGLFGCGAQQDVDFARSVMNGLVAGRYAVRQHIDWNSLMVIEISLGQQYSALPNEKEKTDYERAFIDSFKEGFKGQKATQKSFTHWRIFNDADPKVTYVAADNADGTATFVFYISHKNGKRKFFGIRSVYVKDRAQFQQFEKEQRNVVQTAPQQAQ
jgi:hypothetical protein